MKISDVRIKQRSYEMTRDGYAFYGERLDNKTIGKYIAGWYAKSTGNIIERKTFMDRAAARRHFLDELGKPDRPEHDDFERDIQKRQLYDWEHKFIDPFAFEITRAQAEHIIDVVCADYHVEPPPLHWVESEDGMYRSHYDQQDHEIHMGHRDNITLLHELAHAIDKTNNHDTPHHGPAFVWIAIELYNHYARISLPYMMKSASNKGILGDVRAPTLLNHFNDRNGQLPLGQKFDEPASETEQKTALRKDIAPV